MKWKDSVASGGNDVRAMLPFLLTALLTAACFPPFDLWYLAFVALVPMLSVTARGNGRRDFLGGWLAGWVASTAIVWWVINTITHYGGISWALAIPVLLLMTWAMGLFWGVFSWARGRILKRWPAIPDVLAAPVLWVALEYGRANLPDIDFPWALFGSSQYLNLQLLQSADLFGVWTLSFLLVAANSAVAGLLPGGTLKVRSTGFVARLLPAAAVALVILAAWVYGAGRLKGEPEAGEIRVAVIQGNVEQDVKWDPAFKRVTFDLYANLSREAAAAAPDLIVWPETAAPFFFRREPRYQREMSELARETGAALLFGSPGREGEGKEASLRNRAYLVSADGELQGWYDKMHLVPFGEYVPWKKALFFVDKLVEAVGEFSPGEGPRLLEAGNRRFGTLICYEIIFPDLVRRNVRQGADFLVNITNDAWFGRSAASRQHFSSLVLRAVENRRPVIRAANTGISGFVDSRGRILTASEIFVRGHYSAEVALSSEETLYSRTGDVLPAFCAAVAMALLLAGFRRERSKRYSV
jgi:apolipoprotein N-acyltransferase